MKSSRITLLYSALFGLGAVAVMPSARAAMCDQHCLAGFMQQYLDRLPTHEAAGLPLSPTLNARENTAPMKPGQGAWKTITKVNPGLVLADASTGNVVYAGGVWEDKMLMSLFLRLHVTNGKVAESEMLLRPARGNSGMLQSDIVYDALVPTARQSSRMQLIASANAYMDGISKHDGSIPSFGERCDRYISGFKLTNNTANPRGIVTCATSLDGLANLEAMHRRFTVVDVPTGIVAAQFVVINHGTQPPTVGVVGEVFKVVDGKIRSIEEFGAPAGKYPEDSGFP